MKIMRLFQALLTTFVLVFAGAMLSACGGLTIKEIQLNGFPTEIVQNGTLNVEDISARIIFSDNTTKDVDGSELTITLDTNITLGTNQVRNTLAVVKYQDYAYCKQVQVEVYSATAIRGVNVIPYTGVYTGSSQQAVVEVEGTLAVDSISYSVSNNPYDWVNNAPEFTNAGEHTYYVRISRTGYDDLIVSTTATIIVPNITAYSSELLAAYNDNSTNADKGEQEQFVTTGKTLLAGDDNGFDLQLTASALIDDDEETVSTFETDMTISIWDQTEEQYNVLDDTGLTTYFDNINRVANILDFSNDAIGFQFKISVMPKYIADGYTGITATDYIVKVVDGYNAYTAKDLSLIANVDGMYDRNGNRQGQGWTDWKANNGYSGITTNAIVLQKKIDITDRDIPTGYFHNQDEADSYQAGTVENVDIAGSLKDDFYTGIYTRVFDENDNFAIYGNYFQIDFSRLSKMVITANDSGNQGVKVKDTTTGEGEGIVVHTPLFRFEYKDDTDATQRGTMNAGIYDVDFKGNGARGTDVRNSGGAILAKLAEINVEIENTMYRDCLTGWFFEAYNDDTSNQKTAIILKDSKGYNSYNTLMYSSGHYNVTIIGGEYIGAGGPVLIADHSWGEKNGADGYPSKFNIIGSKFESLVTGYEPWFADNGATALVPQITQLNAAYQQAGATFLQNKDNIANLMNLKVVYKSGRVTGLSNYIVRGNVQFYESMEEYENANKAVDPVAPVHKALDLDTYSSAAVNNGSHLLMNSRTGATFGVTQYVLATTALTGQPETMLVKMADMLAFQEAGTKMAIAKATFDAAMEAVTANPTPELQAAAQAAGQAYQLASITVCSFFCGQYVAEGDNAGLYIGGTLDAGYDLSESFLDGTKLSLANLNVGTPIMNGTTPVAQIASMEMSGFNLLNFTILNPNNGFADVANEGATNLNFYLMNGMGIVLELYKQETPQA